MTFDNAILWDCLRNARPDGSEAINKLMIKLSALALDWPVYTDKMNNLWIDGGGSTLFCSHLDTVEIKEGTKEIYITDNNIHTKGLAVLGADDGAGIGILSDMMIARVPGMYLFTQNEERGGTGGSYAAKYESARIAHIQRAIAFDRCGTDEICGSQCVGTLASVQFVDALSAALGLSHVWGQGTYTDNSEFMDIIPEIVNISCGYSNNHSKNERLDFIYYQNLRDAAISVEWDNLPTIGPAINHKIDRFKMIDYSDNSGYLADDFIGDDDEIVTDTAWNIADDLGINRNTWEFDAIKSHLEAMAFDIRANCDDRADVFSRR